MIDYAKRPLLLAAAGVLAASAAAQPPDAEPAAQPLDTDSDTQASDAGPDAQPSDAGSAAQPPDAGSGAQTDTEAAAGEAEPTPRYRIEFIVFAHTDAAPVDEQLETGVPNAAAEAPIERRWPFGVEPDFVRDAARADAVFGDVLLPPSPVRERDDSAGTQPRPGAAAERNGGREPEADAGTDAAADTGTLTDIVTAGPASLLEPIGPRAFRARTSARTVEPLAAGELDLESMRRRLERLDAYRVLAHAGWEQDETSEAEAHAVDLGELGITNPTGSLKLFVSRFAHVVVDLRYRTDALGLHAPIARDAQEASRDQAAARTREAAGLATDRGASDSLREATSGTDTGDNGGTERSASDATGRTGFGIRRGDRPQRPAVEPISIEPSYVLETRRRARTGELHYIDHPLFGVLMLVTEAPEDPEAPDPADTDENSLAPVP